MKIYAVKTTSGQEETVANFIASKTASKNFLISSVLAFDSIKGYVFVEASAPHIVDEAASGVRHAKGRAKGEIPLSEVEKFLIIKPVVEELNVNDIVEVTSGPFKGLKAKVTNVDKTKGEITIELLEEGFAILPITVHADYVKLLERGVESAREKSG
ncbi:transcription elongation factor Spt5 [Candidatus Bathyarchaeota archaeon]|nr:transcription elongation factor Spt5 [Candidatus Bathyarchaeota archaeon]